jgi:hypothetical protein
MRMSHEDNSDLLVRDQLTLILVSTAVCSLFSSQDQYLEISVCEMRTMNTIPSARESPSYLNLPSKELGQTFSLKCSAGLPPPSAADTIGGVGGTQPWEKRSTI